jgi:uncharacterized membrane protein YccC
VRLSVCVALATALGRALGLERAYWMPMTAAIVLRIDFASTFARGILRIAGTFAGLAIATAVFHFVAAGSGGDVAATIALMFVLRWLGPANYGIVALSVGALVVGLLALTGVSPGPVVVARGINTVLGGAMALVVYAVWPSWERTRIPEALAATLDAYRGYFAAIRLGYEQGLKSAAQVLNRARVAGRVTRTNLEASLDRLAIEPGSNGVETARVPAIMAASHRMIHAMMSLEAGLEAGASRPAIADFGPFADAVERTLALLSGALRAWQTPDQPIPNLRASHNALARRASSALVEIETDRITNSLDTVAEQVLAWVAGETAGPAITSRPGSASRSRPS